MTDLYTEMSEAQVQGRGIKIAEDGDFIVRVDVIKEQESNQDLGTLWVVEYTVGIGTEQNPPNCERSWVQMPERRKKTDLGNIKGFMAALLGYEDPNTAVISGDVFRNAVSEANPYGGRWIKLTTKCIITAKSKQDFTVHTWSPCPDAEIPSDFEMSTPPPAPAPAVPPPPPVEAGPLTKERWMAGEGPGQTHDSAPGMEYNPEHTDWGWRKQS